jgi:hypothetical protein
MKKLAVILSLLLPSVLYGQTETVVIEWDSNSGRLSFPHALYEDGVNTLPYLTRKIPWETRGTVPRVSVELTGTSPVAPGELSGIDTREVAAEPLTELSLVREAGKPFVVLKILPFIQPVPGKLSRVNSLRIRIEQEAALAPLRSERKGSWSDHSVLASGNWYKVAVEQSGMHRLSYEQLQEIGIQNPASVRVYGTGARLLPERFSEGSVDDLQPVPIYISKGSDGLFGPGDHILFFAEGPVSWTFDPEEQFFVHKLHPHALRGYYFLTDSKGPSPVPEDAELSAETPGRTVESYDYRTWFEEETYNLIHSGKEWYGDLFNVNLKNNYAFRIPALVPGEAVRFRITVAARSGVDSDFRVRVNNQLLGTISLSPTDLSNYTATHAYESTGTFETVPASSDVTVTLEYDRPDANSEGWLNHITLNCRSSLDMSGSDELSFRDAPGAGSGKVTGFRVTGGNGTVIWDITDPSAPLNIPYGVSGNDARFTVATDGIREFIAFRPGGDFPEPAYSEEGLGAIENQDLHGLQSPEMIIITPWEFREQAEELAAHRESHDGLDVEVVAQDQVFNEFSSGTPDVSAIRNFLKMFYDRSANPSCRYLLLFGDGSYDNRGQKGKKDNPNLILTYQSDNSLSPTRSYVSDDFFGLLDTDESLYDGLLDIGIGRLPVSTVEEAQDLVEKIIGYDRPERQGDWRNQICFIGDDEDSNIHMRQADALATYVNDHYPAYNINKIYLDAYPQVRTAAGDRYPDVVTAINNQVNRGALIVNYTGHGGIDALAHEKIVTMPQINAWSNMKKLPLFMTATCEFSRYDEYNPALDEEETSAGEKVLLSTLGGGIGLFSTTRLVYSAPNALLNEKFYEVVFEKDANGRNYRLGDIIAYSKNNTGAGINKRNFALLGDPSLRLSYPEHNVVTDSINGISVQVPEDTLSAFEWVRVSGHLETQEGSYMGSFNGQVYPVVFDKERNVETLSNDDFPAWDFKSRNNILYSGKATVTDGRFSFGFYVPKDINYSYGPGKISYYSNDSLVDAHGSCEAFIVGGIGTEHALDGESPVVELYMNDSFFVSGGITDADPSLLVFAQDNFGINTTGNGIGHDLTATLDGDRVNAVILNEFFQAHTDSYNSGVIRYPYSGLDAGPHEITVKIWDIHNNSTEETIEFIVVETEEMLLESLFNYPNPFREHTLFNIEHNRPDREMKLTLTIYNLSGELVRIIEKQVYSAGYRIEPVEWDGCGAGGSRLGGGVYIYRAVLSTEEGEQAEDSGKLILLN